MLGIIYCYTNLINSKKYIGQTINPQQRFNAHNSAAFNEKSPEYDSCFHRALRKYGVENFKYEIIDTADTYEELNKKEIYYIQKFNTLVPNGYNVIDGGNNALRPHSEETKRKLMISHAQLSEDEVIQLRIAYQNHESPTKIFNEKYKGKMHYNSFLNIWTGARYKTIMPEVFKEKYRHTKLNEDIVKQIRIDREKNKMTYQAIADKYQINVSTITDICKYRTWKYVQI